MKEYNNLYNSDGYDKQGYNKEGFNKSGYDREGTNRITGKKDERVQFAEEFIASKKSIEQFAKERQMPPEKVKGIIEEIRTSMCVKLQIESALTSNSNRYLATQKAKKEALLYGKRQ